jgi:hypothetical protein
MDRPATAILAERFMRLFDGMSLAYGTYNVNATREDGKRVGDASTVRGKVTHELWDRHLTGKQGLGVIPIKEDNTCSFGAIDVDIYNLDHRMIASKIKRLGLPLVPCRTKSGGAHIYCFTQVPVAAAKMKSKLSEVASFLGFGGQEIFPKQAHILVDQGDVGQWINMPYFNGVRGMRYAITVEGNALSADDFVGYAYENLATESWFNELLVIVQEFEEGPPCLQALAQVGYPSGTRNDGLYNIGVFLKRSKPDSWGTDIFDFNTKYMQPPLTSPEVQGVVKSLRKKDYAYACTKQPIAQHCNSALCRTRKFGVGSGTTGRFPMLGGLTKLNTKPPMWFWTVEGVRMELTTQDLQDPRAFQRRCMDYLNTMPQLPGAPVWQAAVQHAMDTVNIIEAPADASSEGQFWEMVEKFCTGRAQAMSLDEIVSGKPFSDKGKTYFRMESLLSFLGRYKFYEFKSIKVASMLKDYGAEHHFDSLKGRGVNYWSIREFAKQTEGFDVPGSVKEGGDSF